MPDDGSDAVFVHRKIHGDGRDRTAYLEEGTPVTYEVEWDDQKGKFSVSKCTGFKTGGGGGDQWGGGGAWAGGGAEQWGGKGDYGALAPTSGAAVAKATARAPTTAPIDP